jgi:excisionase family DNA binding protein
MPDQFNAATPAPLDGRLSYTVNDAVAATGIGRSVLYELIQAGDLPVCKIGRRTLIRRSALEALLQKLERDAGAPRAA